MLAISTLPFMQSANSKNFLLKFSLTAAILLINCSYGWAVDARDIYDKMIQTGLKSKSAGFTVESKFININSDTTTVKVDVVLKRDETIKDLKYKIRGLYSDGTLFAFNGKEYKVIIPKDKKFFYVENKLKPSNYILNNWIAGVAGLQIISDPSKFKLDSNTSLIIEKHTIDIGGTECYKVIAFTVMPEKGASKQPGIKEGITEYYIEKKDFNVRKYVQIITRTDNKVQRTEFVYNDLKMNIDADDNQFDLTAPEGYSTEIPKENKGSKPGLLEEGSKAPDFVLKNEKNEDVTLSSFKGKVVMLDFWGTWCGWCLKAMPHIQKVYEKFKDKGLEVVGISCQERPQGDPVKYMQTNNYTYKVLLRGEKVAQDYKVSGFPTFYIINKEGVIISANSGFRQDLDVFLTEFIENALK